MDAEHDKSKIYSANLHIEKERKKWREIERERERNKEGERE